MSKSKGPIFKAEGFLEKSYLDKDGAKHISFEISHESALEIAKLELMARDMVEHRPVLLVLSCKQSENQRQAKDNGNKRRQRKGQFKG